MLPMMRGRLVAINDQADCLDEVPRARAAAGFAEREQNLTWADKLGDDNRIVAGHWWDAQQRGQPLVSLAVEYRDSLGLKLGDRLRFDVAGETFDVTIASFREVKWDSFRPNFFVVFAPGVLDASAGHLHDQRLPAAGQPAAMARWCTAFRAYRFSTSAICWRRCVP